MRIIVMVAALFLCACPALGQPALNENDWNFVLVPTFETPSSTSNNNLSVTGLNHSLRFGQFLKGLTSGKADQIQEIYALTSSENPNDLAALESVQPFALLNNLAISVQSVAVGDPTAYNSPAAFIGGVIGNQPRGIYVLAAPAAVIQELAQALSQNPDASIPGQSDYLVLSGTQMPLSLNGYEDGITPVSTYPDIELPPLSKSCAVAPVTIKAKAPESLKPYLSQTVHLVRHVEAHPTANFENGNYVCQGQWRALGANNILLALMKGKPDYVFSSNPDGLINCGSACSYIRPTLTVAPFAIQHDMPVTLADGFQWNDPESLARSLFDQNSPFFPHTPEGATILVGWEHGNLDDAVHILFKTVYQDPEAAQQLPDWSYTDYDTVWTLKTDGDGNLTFTNSCEHIPTASLPTTCPAFWQ